MSMKYHDCQPGCGGEDCPCCEIWAEHQHDNDPSYDDDYDIYGNSRFEYEEDYDDE